MAIGSACIYKHYLLIFDETGMQTGRYRVPPPVTLVGFTLARVTIMKPNSGLYVMFDDKATIVSAWYG
jgi:hypothetical protein